MDLKQVLKDLSYTLIQGSLDTIIIGVEYDSRAVKKQSLFVAIEGYATDGHKYIEVAIENGASTIILEKTFDYRSFPDVTFIEMANTRRGLAQISSNFFGNPGQDITVFGVTGTNGKTSITYLLKHILKNIGSKVGVVGTIENQIDEAIVPSKVTTPESRDLQYLLRRIVNEGCNYCVMEASSHALYLDRVYGVPFSAGIFTNLTQDHLDFHDSLESYLEAKKILFHSLKEDGFAIINFDDPASESILKDYQGKYVTYGIHKSCDFRAENIVMDLFGTRYTLNYNGHKLTVHLKLIGEFSIYNSLGAITTALTYGLPADKVLEGVSQVTVNGRFQLVDGAKDFAVVVDYAHTPDGLLNVLQTGRKLTTGRVIGVFGCGGDRDKKKRPIMGRIGGENSDIVIITSDNPRTEDPDSIIDMIEVGVQEVNNNYYKIENRKEAIKKAIEIARKDDIIIIAGKGHEDYQILGKTKYPFSDVKIAKKILEKVD